MAEKTIFEKMRIKPGMTHRVIGLPDELKSIYLSLDNGVILSDLQDTKADVLHLFVNSMAELENSLPGYASKLKPGGTIWICYPKLSSSKKSDISRDIIWRYVEQFNFKPVAMVSMNETWSAFRLKIN